MFHRLTQVTSVTSVTSFTPFQRRSLRVWTTVLGVLLVLTAWMSQEVLANSGTVSSSTPVKAPVTHESLWLMKRIGSPLMSPNGQWVVFSVTEPAYDRAETQSDLWLMATDGQSKPRQLTHTKAPESGVSWSPDSQRILFSSKRDGDNADQVYVLNINQAGEAQRVTHSAMGAHNAQFSPDGRSIAYVTNMWPGAYSEAENKKLEKQHNEQKAKVRVYEQYPIRSWDHWLDERKPHILLQSLDEGATAEDVFKGSQFVSQAGYQGRMGDDGARLDFSFTLDGKALIFAATTEMDESARAFIGMPLWKVAITGGEPVRLSAPKDQYGNLRLSADGQYLYADRSAASTHVYSHTHVVRFALKGVGDQVTLGAMEDLLAGCDCSASSYAIAHDGSIAFSSEAAGLDVIYLAKAGQAPVKLYAQNRGVYSGVNLSGDYEHPTVVARYETATQPGEVVSVNRSGTPKALTSFAQAEAAQLDWQPLEAFSFKDSHGHMIHNWLVKPAHFDPSHKYPLIVLMHGGPASMWKDQISLRWNYHLIAGTRYVLVLTDYKGSTGYGEAFANAIEKDPLKGPADEINQGADEAIKRFGFIDGSKQCAAGASYGGHLSNWMQASTKRYRCLVSHAGLIDLTEQWGTSDSNYHREVMVGSPPWEANPLWTQQSPLHYAKDFKTPVLVTVGERDFRVPLPNTLTYWAALQRQHVPSRLLVFPDENHWILNADNSKRYYQELDQWFTKYLGQ